MPLWMPWWNAIWLLRPAFSRLRTFMWFAAAVAGFTVRTELLGVTSIVRALKLETRFYDSLLRGFHSSAVQLDRLTALWAQAVLRLFPQPLRVNGRAVLVGDGIKVPVLFLTAKGEVDDLVEGLAAGGDDYVAKPFSLAEVVARTKALLRRSRPEEGEDTRLRFADVVLDEQTHEVWRAGTPVKLTATEFNVLRLFMLNPRRVLSKDQIIDHVWHYDFGGNQNIVETYVRYVRRKLDALGPPLIHTIRLVGYVLREPEAT